MCGWCKKKDNTETQEHAGVEALGRSMGGFSCKIHAAVDALGNPLRLILTPGQSSDIGQAENLVVSINAQKVLADKGYDSGKLVEWLTKEGMEAVIPSRSNAKEPRQCDWWVYKERHLVECFFGKIKHYRRVFSRFEKKSCNFMAFLHFVSVLIWFR